MIRTSRSHPLEIAVVALGALQGAPLGRIGITFCPGKKDPQATTGPWDRDLASDLAASPIGARRWW
jgi:ADP-ribosyl-[dinitrogen reductase] hydrolase